MLDATNKNDGFLVRARRKPQRYRGIARICNAALAEKTRFYVADSVQHHTRRTGDAIQEVYARAPSLGQAIPAGHSTKKTYSLPLLGILLGGVVAFWMFAMLFNTPGATVLPESLLPLGRGEWSWILVATATLGVCLVSSSLTLAKSGQD